MLTTPDTPAILPVRESSFSQQEFSDQREADQHTSSGSSSLVGGPAAP